MLAIIKIKKNQKSQPDTAKGHHLYLHIHQLFNMQLAPGCIIIICNYHPSEDQAAVFCNSQQEI
jgi:hypothetical protein